jgi:sulfite exporter TauE/SafE
MCGPFAAAADPGSAAQPRISGRVAYHLGRLCTYCGLGAAAGTLGRALDLAGALAGLGRASALVASAAMLLLALRAFLPNPKLLQLGRGPRPSGRWLAKVLELRLLGAVPRGFVLGLATTLIPCGWLYAFVVMAAGTGSAGSALLVMVTFWTGTLPALMAVRFGVQRVASRVSARARRYAMGTLSLAGGALILLRLGGPAPLPASSANATAPMDCPLHRR